jgi:hypothetical protein
MYSFGISHSERCHGNGKGLLVARRVRRFTPRDFGVSAVVIHELYYGALKS